ncbi:MAG: hypothetical protein IJO28_05685 [Oscillospiraceae bacterium]|nr:hypothetical protein [Oscillospiraceae bacterium]
MEEVRFRQGPHTHLAQEHKLTDPLRRWMCMDQKPQQTLANVMGTYYNDSALPTGTAYNGM